MYYQMKTFPNCWAIQWIIIFNPPIQTWTLTIGFGKVLQKLQIERRWKHEMHKTKCALSLWYVHGWCIRYSGEKHWISSASKIYSGIETNLANTNVWAKKWSEQENVRKNLSTFFKCHFIAVLIVSPLNRISSMRTTIEQLNDLNKCKYVNFYKFLEFSLLVSLVFTIWTWTSIGFVTWHF